MKIGLYDVDSHGFPNLAIMRLSAYHKAKGDDVEILNNFNSYDRVYVSKIFKFSHEDETVINSKEIVRGGSGVDLKTTLPADVERSSAVDYLLYNYEFSIQFFSRGCVRRCPFCVVPEKEGLIHAVDPVDLNPRGKWIEILDNNFFASPGAGDAIKYLQAKKMPVNFHGVDARLINEEQCRALSTLRHAKGIKIAWDNPKDDMTEKFEIIARNIKPRKILVYVLIGYNSTPDEDLYRVRKIENYGFSPFVMAFDKADHY